MANEKHHRFSAPATTGLSKKAVRGGATLLICLELTVISPSPVSGLARLATAGQQSQQEQQRQQQEQQQREQEQREQQAREQQQREQEQREQQAREQQQREQEQREQQAREQQQQREQQAREEQQRQQQAREHQQRDERQREEQERQRKTPSNPVNSSNATSPSLDSSVSTPFPAASQVSNGSFATSSKPNAATESHVPSQPQPGAKPVAPRAQTPEPDVRTNAAASDGKNTTAKDHNLRLPPPDLRHKPCDNEPCAEPGPKPVPPDLHAKVCKDGPCPICAPGQSPGKYNSCVSATLAKGAIAPSKTSAVPQACPSGQIWNGIQCAPVGAQQCLPGQTGAGPSCQTNCAIATAGAQNYIELLRMARQEKDQACSRNPTQQECQQAESTYNIRLNEYRTFLVGVSTTCTLPDPVSI